MAAFLLALPRGSTFLVIGGTESSVVELLDLNLKGSTADAWGSHEVGWVVTEIPLAAWFLAFG